MFLRIKAIPRPTTPSAPHDSPQCSLHQHGRHTHTAGTTGLTAREALFLYVVHTSATIMLIPPANHKAYCCTRSGERDVKGDLGQRAPHPACPRASNSLIPPPCQRSFAIPCHSVPCPPRRQILSVVEVPSAPKKCVGHPQTVATKLMVRQRVMCRLTDPLHHCVTFVCRRCMKLDAQARKPQQKRYTNYSEIPVYVPDNATAYVRLLLSILLLQAPIHVPIHKIPSEPVCNCQTIVSSEGVHEEKKRR